MHTGSKPTYNNESKMDCGGVFACVHDGIVVLNLLSPVHSLVNAHTCPCLNRMSHCQRLAALKLYSSNRIAFPLQAFVFVRVCVFGVVPFPLLRVEPWALSSLEKLLWYLRSKELNWFQASITQIR